MHPAQPSRASAAEKTKQDCLGLIVFGMSHRYGGSSEPRRRTFEKFVPRCVRCLLQRHPCLSRQRADVHTFDLNRDTASDGQTLAEFLILIGGKPTQLMVQMGSAGQFKALCVADLSEYMQQGNRIGSSGQRHDDARATLNQLVALDRPTNNFN
jgi:hypothetical protein